MRKGELSFGDTVILFDGSNAEEIAAHSSYVALSNTVDGTALSFSRDGENLSFVNSGEYVGYYGVYNAADLGKYVVTVTEEIPEPEVVQETAPATADGEGQVTEPAVAPVAVTDAVTDPGVVEPPA